MNLTGSDHSIKEILEKQNSTRQQGDQQVHL